MLECLSSGFTESIDKSPSLLESKIDSIGDVIAFPKLNPYRSIKRSSVNVLGPVGSNEHKYLFRVSRFGEGG